MKNDKQDLIKVDLLVLGAGPGGYTAAFRAADLGLQVALVDKRKTLGGVCLNEGCIPSKALLQSVGSIISHKNLSDLSIVKHDSHIDYVRLREWKNSVVKKLCNGLSGLAKRRKVQVINGNGRFIDGNTLQVGDVDIEFAQAIISTGSSAVKLPNLPNDDRIMDSTQALGLSDIPERLLIIGGGVIGVEMASIYSGLGSKVSIVELQDQLIPSLDREIADLLAKNLKGSLSELLLSTKLKSVDASNNFLEVKLQTVDGKEINRTVDKILVAVGRTPNTKDLGLDKIGIEPDAGGKLVVDEQQRTKNKNIYAIGDITDGPMLAHKASYEGSRAAEVIAGQKSANLAKYIPQVAYCIPEVAWVGMSEEQCKIEGKKYIKSSFPWVANGRFHTMNTNASGLTKVITDAETNMIIGIAMLGPHAGDLISEAVLAMEAGLEAGDLSLTIHPHPTLSETLMCASQLNIGTVTEI